jgi:hypothetical protein
LLVQEAGRIGYSGDLKQWVLIRDFGPETWKAFELY